MALGFFTSSVTLTAFFTEDDPERETTRSLRCHKIGYVALVVDKIVNRRVKSSAIYMQS